MNKNTHIACALHDYIEIACLFGYRLKITLNDGKIIVGQAKGLTSCSDKREYLILDNNKKQRIELIRISKIKTMTPNARFDEIRF